MACCESATTTAHLQPVPGHAGRTYLPLGWLEIWRETGLVSSRRGGPLQEGPAIGGPHGRPSLTPRRCVWPLSAGSAASRGSHCIWRERRRLTSTLSHPIPRSRCSRSAPALPPLGKLRSRTAPAQHWRAFQRDCHVCPRLPPLQSRERQSGESSSRHRFASGIRADAGRMSRTGTFGAGSCRRPAGADWATQEMNRRRRNARHAGIQAGPTAFRAWRKGITLPPWRTASK